MKRMILAAVVGLGLAAGANAGDCGPGCGAAAGKAGCGECDSGKYGANSFLKRLMWWKKDDGCDPCGDGKKGKLLDKLHGPRLGHHGCSGCGDQTPPPGIGYPGTPGAQMPGTLVFPNHPFMRSPRDFFMYEPK
ncbi:MAG: hypothetical protein U0871_10870 [Gemmataceae bacterium]